MVVWSERAKKDLRGIYDFIALDSEFYAKKVVNEIVEKSVGLEVFPNKGKIVSELNLPNIRELIIYSYRIIYE